LSGENGRAVREHASTLYNEVTIANVPLEGKTDACDPSEPALELYGGIHKRSENKSKSNVLSSVPNQQIKCAVLYCTDPNESLQLMVDNRIVPGLNTIRISVLPKILSDPSVPGNFQLPLSTFLPMDFH
jgi:hypothetical protein